MADLPGYVFGEKHRAYMRRAYRHTVNVAEGAVRAGKTVDNVFVFAALLEDAPDRIHLASGSTLGNAKLNLGDCNGLGLERLFAGRCGWTRYRDNECLRIATRTGEKLVLFTGGKNADAYKRIRGNSYGMWLATEINHHHDSFLMEAVNRTLAARDRRLFWDLNPCAPNAPIYRDYLDKYAAAERAGFYNYGHFTIADNPVITPERMAEIAAQYDPGSVWYRRDILGERCAAEGLIYRMFADDPAAYAADGTDFPAEFINIGVDFGGNRSRTAFVAVGFAESGIAALAEGVVGGEKGEIDPERINREFRRFLGELQGRYSAPVRYVFCDSEAQYLETGLRRSVADTGIRVTDCVKKPICDRIAFMNRMMATKRFSYDPSCRNLCGGLCAAVWDETGDRRRDDFTSDIDILDAFEYAVERYMGKY